MRFFPSISPSGTKVAYTVRAPGQSRQRTLFIAPFVGGPPKQVCRDCGDPRQWTLDEVAMVTEEGGKVNLVTLNDGTWRVLADREDDPAVYDGNLSPDGKWVAFHQVVGATGRQIFVSPVLEDTSTTRQDWMPITDGSYLEGRATWSPNGQLLYFLSDRDGSHCIWAQRLDAATKQPVGAPFEVYGIHDARRRLLGRTNFGGIGLNVLEDRLVFSIDETTGNIWMARYQ